MAKQKKSGLKITDRFLSNKKWSIGDLKTDSTL